MAETYSDFAQVYDELMDDTPYAQWCETVVELIKQYGISKPVREAKVAINTKFEAAGGGIADSGVTGGGIAGTDAVNGGINDGDAGECAGAVDAGIDMADLLASERNLVLDLGCGTGTFTELLAEHGYDMVGVDNAPAMLDIAMRKKEASGSQTLYLLQDMRELELYSTVGTVVSVCDCVNYILEEAELLQVFRLVNNYLYPGGIFLFDFNTEYKYREVIGDATIAENREDCSFIWENYYDAETQLNEYDVTVFVREDWGQEELYRRFSETHIQRGYTVSQMKRLVENAGMELVKIMDADTLADVSENSGRVYILARECQKGKEDRESTA